MRFNEKEASTIDGAYRFKCFDEERGNSLNGPLIQQGEDEVTSSQAILIS
ncbi:uncharacterized protein PHALS_03445 [Plasmopara halstedii]|uniref:Uncharacterized protein n=1 Tax=Plasmopara halstedii TaxID=4781 RepID=A0A0N7L7D4_PLAHL|nr:uncharacterized protein PHALS_03445 [Plasmopara halstedii]CEG46763.1 hypothetical protein PHALS_03445 [Plasmopara halstedii]|eukprot:XP_024583132.1 hypothetical protein PHALS_03445 [Plasmopara halstedii]